MINMCITFETVSKENTVLEKIEIKSGQYDEKKNKIKNKIG